MNVGFIGLGGMGRLQVSAFAQVKSCRVVAGADLSPAAREAFAGEHPGATVYEDYHQLLADEKVDAVVICLPTYLHVEAVAAATKAKLPVLCEKPLSLTTATCRKMIEQARRAETLLMVGHCRRYDADWGQMGKIVTGDMLGRPVLWRSIAGGRGPAAPWFMDDTKGGGPLMDGAIHNYDFANLIFGDPVSVIAQSIKLTGSSAMDTATAIVEYPQGDQLLVSWSWGIAASGGGVTDILGPKASLLFGAGPLDSPDLDKKKYGYYCVSRQKDDRRKLVRFSRQNMYVNQAKHFLACIAGKKTCLSPATEAIKAVAVAEAVLKSAAAHGRRIKVTW